MTLSKFIKPNMKGALYARYSSDGQTITAQRSSILQFAEKHNLKIINEFLDEGVSAVKNDLDKRPEIMSLLQEAEQQKFDFIAIQYSDRIARDPIEHITIKLQLKEIGIPVFISTSETIYDTNVNNLHQLMLDGFSKYEVDNIKTRTLDGLKARAELGKFTGGNSPYGYRYLKKKAIFVSILEEIETVKVIFELYKKGDGWQCIAEKLPPETCRIKEWTKEKVRSILLNPFYAGFISYNKRSKNNTSLLNNRELWIMAPAHYIDPIISIEEWEICWRLYNERKEMKVDPKHLKTSFLLRGLLKCKNCDTLFKTKDQRTKGKNKVYGEVIYYCPECKLRVTTDYIHDMVVNDILNDIRTFTFDQVYQKVDQKFKQEIVTLNEDIEKLKTTIRTYKVKKTEIKELTKEQMIKFKESNSEDVDCKKTIGILTVYKQQLTKRMVKIQNLIDNKTREIELRENASLNRNIWLNVLENVMGDRTKIEPMDIRRLFIPLVKHIKIDDNLVVEYQLRIDNKKRKSTNQISIPL